MATVEPMPDCDPYSLSCTINDTICLEALDGFVVNYLIYDDKFFRHHLELQEFVVSLTAFEVQCLRLL